VKNHQALEMALASTFVARLEVTKNRPARPVYTKPQIIVRPGLARGPLYTVTSKAK